MDPLPELEWVTPQIALWHGYDSSVKADLFSTALCLSSGTCVIDPIQVGHGQLEELHATKPIHSIVITNQNHWRATIDLARHFSVPIFAHGRAQLEPPEQPVQTVADDSAVCGELVVITIDGAAPGEIALLSHLDDGSLIVGDALINFEPYGFTLLPAKYCADHKTMRKSLRRLLDRPFERIFFAHGLPILSGGRAHLQALLDSK
jgi:glyoxylase-like metal-dependent hydrolase (beta-lactamase superfamily II)